MPEEHEMTNEYPKYEIQWNKVLDNKGEPVKSKDGAEIVTSGAVLLPPKLLMNFGVGD